MSGPDDSREAWEKVRSAGRLSFHVIVTGATVVVCVVAEAVGKLLFRGGHGLADGIVSAAMFGLLAGALLSFWLWKRQEK